MRTNTRIMYNNFGSEQDFSSVNFCSREFVYSKSTTFGSTTHQYAYIK